MSLKAEDSLWRSVEKNLYIENDKKGETGTGDYILQ